MKRRSPELLKIQCKRAPGRSCRPPVDPEEKEGKMRAQPGAWEVQLNVFKGDPPNTPNRGSPDHLQSFSKRRTFKLLVNSQREPLPFFIRGDASSPSMCELGRGGWRDWEPNPHSHPCCRLPLRLEPEGGQGFHFQWSCKVLNYYYIWMNLLIS